MNVINPNILHIETATQICSVAVSKGMQILSLREINIPNAHSSKLSLLIEEVLFEAKIKYTDLDAISVSKGPGSYTGLRIGVSTAKGLAYALEIPLISVETLCVLWKACVEKYPQYDCCSMIDAKRMEVYAAIYDNNGNCKKEVSADIIEKGIYDEFLSKDKGTVFVGDGAEKCKEVFEDNVLVIIDKEVQLCSKYMVELSYEKYKKGEFEDVAYFEPYYLKNFVAAPSKVKGLYSDGKR